MRVWIPASESLYLIALSSANYEAMAFATNLILQVAERLASVDLSAALGGVVAVLTGFSVVNLENLLGCNCHNRLLLVFISYPLWFYYTTTSDNLHNLMCFYFYFAGSIS